MAVTGGRRDQSAIADPDQASKRERLRMIPLHLASVDLGDEGLERQADSCADLAIEERTVLVIAHVDDRGASVGVGSDHRSYLALQDGIGVGRVALKSPGAGDRSAQGGENRMQARAPDSELQIELLALQEVAGSADRHRYVAPAARDR